jgi:hypothetical protein
VAGPALAAEQEDPEVARVVVPAAAEPVVVEAVIGNHVIPLQTFSSVFKSLFFTAHPHLRIFLNSCNLFPAHALKRHHE